MSFLAPLYLLGLLALLAPVLAHLRRRERRDAVPFPSLMFLQRVPYRSLRRRRLEHLLLFALRCLALALLAVAFARPFLGQAVESAAPALGARERVVLLDRSFSMGHGDRFARAQSAALRSLRELGPEDRGSLLLFSERAVAVVRSSAEQAALLAAVSEAAVGSGGTRYGPALELARDTLRASSLPRREAVLISDFQKAGWQTPEPVRLPDGATLGWVDVGEADASNAAVADVSLDREFATGRERVAAVARVVNKGPRPLEGLRLRLELAGRLLEEQPLQLAARGAASVRFEPFAFPSAATRGVVRLEQDALPADNVFSFVLSPGQDVGVLILDGDSSPSGSLYLRRALAIGTRPRFALLTRQAAAVSEADVGSSAAVALLPGARPGQAALTSIERAVRGGAGLLVVLGGLAADAALPAGVARLLPGLTEGPVDRTGDLGATLAFLDYEHPALALFKAPRSGDFSGARFSRYRAFRPAEGTRVLARFDDGGVALAEAGLGGGRVLAWAAGFDAVSSDLPLQPVFLPFAHQLFEHLAGHRETPAFVRVGDVVDLGQWGGAGAELTLQAPSGAKRRLPPAERLAALGEAGFFEVRSRGGELLGSVAVNVPLAESDLARLDPEELAASVRPESGADGRPALAAAPEDAERRQSLWWYALLAVGLLLLAETALSNRVSRAVR